MSGVLLPKLDEASARGNLFEKMFGIMPFGQAQLDDDVPLPLFQLTKIHGYGKMEKESGLRLVSSLTMRNKFYLQSQNGTGRVYFSPTPELRLKISEDMSMFRTWTISPYCQHKLHLDPEKKEAPRWEGRKEHPLVRNHQNHQKWKKSFNEEKDSRHRPGDTLSTTISTVHTSPFWTFPCLHSL